MLSGRVCRRGGVQACGPSWRCRPQAWESLFLSGLTAPLRDGVVQPTSTLLSLSLPGPAFLPVVRACVGVSGSASAPGGGPEVARRCVRGQPAPVLEIVGGHWVGFSSG